MPCNVNRLIEVARNEVGYLEKATWNQLDDKTANAGDQNYVKYSRDLAQHQFYNSSKKGVAWCDIFVDWCMCTAFGPDAAKKLLCQPSKSAGASCRHSMQYYKNKEQFHDSDPRPGDQIFFWPTDRSDPEAVQHTALVVRVTSSRVYTIEGNTTSDAGVVYNGGCVAEKKYRLDFERIAGYGRPDYEHIDPDAGYGTDSMNSEANMMDKTTATVIAESGSNVNMRKTPSTTAAVIMKVPVGATVTVNDHNDTWSQIVYNGTTGYMMVKFLDIAEADQAYSDLSADELAAKIQELVSALVTRAR